MKLQSENIIKVAFALILICSTLFLPGFSAAASVEGKWSSDFQRIGSHNMLKYEFAFYNDASIGRDRAASFTANKLKVYTHRIIDAVIGANEYRRKILELDIVGITWNDERSKVIVKAKAISHLEVSFAPEWVETWNQRQHCGFEDWQVGVEKELIDVTCEYGLQYRPAHKKNEIHEIELTWSGSGNGYFVYRFPYDFGGENLFFRDFVLSSELKAGPG